MLYFVRYKQAPAADPLQALIEAADDEQALAIGQAWCDLTKNAMGGQRKLLGNPFRAVVADATILKPPEPVDVQWELQTAVQRLARIQGKTEDEVRTELRGGKKPLKPTTVVPGPNPEAIPASVESASAATRASLKDRLFGKPDGERPPAA